MAVFISIWRALGALVGIKDIENRTWRTTYRGRIYIHVSAPKKFDVQLTDDQMIKALPIIPLFAEGKAAFGAIIGEVDIVDCVIGHKSVWAEKKAFVMRKENGIYHELEVPVYNWVLANPVLYDKPIENVKGALSLWYYKQGASKANAPHDLTHPVVSLHL
ncbi:hypothetical protein [Pedobacter sp. KBW06]|uniref:hypothetical protein n=1 Tax=Pedobacter sp. KBW06 TaxID=2153359 RepID=UPI0018F385DE|nr:hypothetical protein [Pedobacter sp. KBW06]